MERNLDFNMVDEKIEIEIRNFVIQGNPNEEPQKSAEEYNLKCDVCEFSCDKNEDMNNHISSAHFPGDICDIEFFSKKSLEAHNMSIHEKHKIKVNKSILKSNFPSTKEN